MTCYDCGARIRVEGSACYYCAAARDEIQPYKGDAPAETLEDVCWQYPRWAARNGFTETRRRALVKLMEEVGELAAAIHRRDSRKTADAVADVFISLLKVPLALNVDPVECIVRTWNEVKQRDYKRFPENGRTE